MKQFGLFLDDDRALRCKGKLNNSSLDLGSRNPILLPLREQFVELLIHEIHNHVKHNGILQQLYANVSGLCVFERQLRKQSKMHGVLQG